MSDLTIEEQQTAAKVKKILDTSIVVSNIIELATSVILDIAGKDTADTIGDQSLNRNVLANLVADRVKVRVLSEGN